MFDAQVYRKNPDVVTREIGGETILIPLFHSSEDLNYIYTLNETAARFWSLIDGEKSVEEIQKGLLEEYEIDPSVLNRNVEELVKDLTSISALIPKQPVDALQ